MAIYPGKRDPGALSEQFPSEAWRILDDYVYEGSDFDRLSAQGAPLIDEGMPQNAEEATVSSEPAVNLLEDSGHKKENLTQEEQIQLMFALRDVIKRFNRLAERINRQDIYDWNTNPVCYLSVAPEGSVEIVRLDSKNEIMGSPICIGYFHPAEGEGEDIVLHPEYLVSPSGDVFEYKTEPEAPEDASIGEEEVIKKAARVLQNSLRIKRDHPAIQEYFHENNAFFERFNFEKFLKVFNELEHNKANVNIRYDSSTRAVVFIGKGGENNTHDIVAIRLYYPYYRWGGGIVRRPTVEIPIAKIGEDTTDLQVFEDYEYVIGPDSSDLEDFVAKLRDLSNRTGLDGQFSAYLVGVEQNSATPKPNAVSLGEQETALDTRESDQINPRGAGQKEGSEGSKTLNWRDLPYDEDLHNFANKENAIRTEAATAAGRIAFVASTAEREAALAKARSMLLNHDDAAKDWLKSKQANMHSAPSETDPDNTVNTARTNSKRLVLIIKKLRIRKSQNS